MRYQLSVKESFVWQDIDRNKTVTWIQFLKQRPWYSSAHCSLCCIYHGYLLFIINSVWGFFWFCFLSHEINFSENEKLKTMQNPSTFIEDMKIYTINWWQTCCLHAALLMFSKAKWANVDYHYKNTSTIFLLDGKCSSIWLCLTPTNI